ncbi:MULTISPECIES: DNA methyltransferase [unclassified Acinetobacter]|uniref:DNA methyltransferase n=1 Tax=unclassified Acinetobacter TaxID=196816 RepID=UPI0015D3BF2C|nr:MULTISPECIES: DNA methyltransferase [unclassified Acinetobacter]
MNIVQIEENIKQLIHRISKGELHQKEFIYELLLAYGLRKYSINKLRSGDTNLAEDKENTLFWKLKVYFKIAKQHDLHSLIDQMKNEKRTESNKIRFLIVTDFTTLLAVDTKTQDTMDVPFSDLAKKFDFFLPWAGMEKAVYQGENPADVKAAEKLAKLFDEIKADNFDEDDLNNKENLHQLNIFLSRLLFCYFAEDTEIFKDKQFTSAISKSNEDGSDLSSLIGRLFKVLNQSSEDRETDLPDYLADFPYVNGGLFKDDIQVPKFTRKSRRILIECGAELDWSDINPDIFGSMFQAVVHTEQRSTMGQHYTSVPNIMKVIEPLFLNDLYEELEKNQDSVNKLLKLQQRLGQLKIFDPACGSGNFLIIAYKELRKFEMELLKRVQELELEKTGQFSKPFSVIQVSQFYGIEIDDFAHEVAILSLWLTEHQMNMAFRDEFGEILPTLPLKDSGNIYCNNSLLVDWESLFDNRNLEVYILGNPPYLGSKLQTQLQKKQLNKCFINSNIKTTTLDYIYGWFYKACKFVHFYKSSHFSFVTTNSIFQGEQVETIFKLLLMYNLEIRFAYQSFKWRNNARHNAGVTCVIVGISSPENIKEKTIYQDDKILSVKNINAYLVDSENLVVTKRNTPLSVDFPKMNFGNMANDGGGLILTKQEYEEILSKYPSIKYLLLKLLGASEFIKGTPRYCLWINDEDLNLALSIPEIKDRIERTKIHRLSSKDPSCNRLATRSHQFRDLNRANQSQIIIPRVSSENREYIPIGILSNEIIILDSAMAIYDAEPWLFSILTSKMHMAWVKVVGGRLKTDYRYSASVIYNNFPCPKLSERKKEILTTHAFNILSIRENYPNKTLAELYNFDSMPLDLRTAHEENDKYVDSLYTAVPLKTDEQRLEGLFKLYEKMKV